MCKQCAPCVPSTFLNTWVYRASLNEYFDVEFSPNLQCLLFIGDDLISYRRWVTLIFCLHKDLVHFSPNLPLKFLFFIGGDLVSHRWWVTLLILCQTIFDIELSPHISFPSLALTSFLIQRVSCINLCICLSQASTDFS